MLKVLIRLRMQELMSQLNRRKKRGIAQNLSQGAYAVLMGLVYLFCAFSIFQIFDEIAEPMIRLNAGSLYFGYSSIIGFGLALIGSVFATQSQLFEAKDNDTLLSMPIRPSMILASRMISLYIQALLYESIMMIPAGVAWFVHKAPFRVSEFACWFIPTLFVPMLAVTVGIVLGWVLAMTGQTLKAIWPAYQYGLACAGHWGSVLNVILVTTIPLVCAWLFVSRFFFHIVNDHHRAKRVEYVEKKLPVFSPRHALLVRERRRLFSDGSYVLNSALGILMAPVFTIVFLIFRGDILEVMDKLLAGVSLENVAEHGFFSAIEDTGLIAVAVFLCLLATTISITAPSLSLEGKTIWHAGILPVRGRDFLLAKVKLHLLMCVPVFVVCSTVFQFCLPGSIAARLLLLISPVMMNVLIALLGMVMNVLHPRFDWISSQQCIKRSMPVFVCMLGGFFLIVLSGYVYIQWLADILNLTQFLAICTVLMAAISAGLFAWLVTGGEKRLNTYFSF